MKILILQLARLGDIYQTWPTIRALKRTLGSDIKVDMLIRSRFAAATTGLSEVDQLYSLDSKGILGSVICDDPRPEASFERFSAFVESLKKNNYDRIINLSFSTFSSYLTESLSATDCKVNGYSRFNDGFLNIPDDVSSYFFAQVGVGLNNRIHVTDLFAQTAEVELLPCDFGKEKSFEPKRQIAIHLGASSEFKRLSIEKWSQLIAALQKRYSGEIFLIGSIDEANLGEQIARSLSSPQITNYVGMTSLQEVMRLISESELLIGADSAPVHIAALTDTPVFNLSFESVNFWETGPKSKDSLVFKMKAETDLTEQLFLEAVDAILYDEKPPAKVIAVDIAAGSFVMQEFSFGWEMNKAIYMGGELPYISDYILREAMIRLFEANELALEQLEALKLNSKSKIALTCFEQCDHIFSTIERLSPEIGPLVRWVRAEKLRIPPGEYTDVLKHFELVHAALEKLLKTYPLENWNQLKNGVLNDKNILDEA